MKSGRSGFFQSKFFLCLLVLLGASVFWWWSPRFIIVPLQTAGNVVLRPFQSAGSALGYSLRSQVLFFSSLKSIKQQNRDLQKENLTLKAENAAQKQAIAENEELKRNLDLLPRQKYQLLSATIISKDSLGLMNTITINRGEAGGVSVGMPAVVEAGVLVGEVVEVFPTTATVRLITHEASVVNAETTSNAIKGVVRGSQGLSIKLDMVEQGQELHIGDGVVTSGLGGKFPKGLLIGTLGDIALSEDRLFQQATLTSPVDMRDLRFIFLVQE